MTLMVCAIVLFLSDSFKMLGLTWFGVKWNYRRVGHPMALSTSVGYLFE
jgi:hypothetical protein